MKQRLIVELTTAEREALERLIAAGAAPARKPMHARILLKANRSPAGPAWVDTRIAEAVEVSQPTIARVRRQFVDQGLTASLNRRAPHRYDHRKLDGAQRASGRPGPRRTAGRASPVEPAAGRRPDGRTGVS